MFGPWIRLQDRIFYFAHLNEIRANPDPFVRPDR